MGGVTVIGEIYLDLKTEDPVRVIGGQYRKWTSAGYIYFYTVENILTGEHLRRIREELGEKALNEMEVIAWTAI